MFRNPISEGPELVAAVSQNIQRHASACGIDIAIMGPGFGTVKFVIPKIAIPRSFDC